MSRSHIKVVLLLLVAAPVLAAGSGVEPPAWLEDSASQILVRAMLEEAGARNGPQGRGRSNPGESRPTAEDLERATVRVFETLDDLLLLAGLAPLEVRPMIAGQPREEDGSARAAPLRGCQEP